MHSKDLYGTFCDSENGLPIFMQYWWLDAVAGKDNWDVIVAEKGGHITACMPYYKQKEYIFSYISMPKLTQHLGVWLNYPADQKYTNRLSFEKKVITDMIDNLPPFDWYRQSFHHSFTNWLPFYWSGFKQTTKYTYRIENIESLEKVFANFRDNLRWEIRKAERRVRIETTEDLELYYQMNRKTFSRQNRKMPYDFNLLQSLDSACRERGCRTILIAKDNQGKIHSAAYFIWDDSSVYYLMGGSDPEMRNSGAASLILYEAVKVAAEQNKSFDFEGSMAEPIERFFRSFGARQTPYFHIEKINSRLIKFKRALTLI